MWFFVCASLFLYYIFIRLSCGITRSSTCLLGKTAIVTGANSGLGYQTVLNLASRGCKVIMADVANMEEAQKNIIKFTNNTNIITKNLDLSSFKSVREFASEILKTEERLDILINNGGIGTSKNNRTEDGLHPVMQINYFSHFLLTHLLIELLKKSTPSRVVFTSSFGAFFNNLSLDNLTSTDTFNNSTVARVLCYGNSKLALLIVSDIFAEKLKGSGVTSNSIHPGFVTTSIFTNAYSITNNILFTFTMSLYNWIYSKDAWEGSQTLVHVAVSKKLEQVTGKYFWDCKPFIKPPKAYDAEFCNAIWKASEKCVKLRPEEKL